MLRCRLLGHRVRFVAEGRYLRWYCARECGAGGGKRYEREKDARRYASALERAGGTGRDRRAPAFGLLPLRIAGRVRGR